MPTVLRVDGSMNVQRVKAETSVHSPQYNVFSVILYVCPKKKMDHRQRYVRDGGFERGWGRIGIGWYGENECTGVGKVFERQEFSNKCSHL